MKKFLKKYLRGLMAAVMAAGPLAPSVEAMPLAAFGPARAVPSIRAMSGIPRDRKGFFHDATHTVTRTDAKGQKTVRVMDPLGRLRRARTFTAANVLERDTTYAYDGNNNLIAWQEGSRSASLAYDPADRKTGETVTLSGSPAVSYTWSCQYDKASRKTGYLAPDGTRYAYAYTAADELAKITLPGLGDMAYSYSAPGLPYLPGSVTHPAGNQVFTYDSRARVKDYLSRNAANAVVVDRAYAYDDVDNIQAIQTERGPFAFTYDPIYQITQANMPSVTETFTYDPSGNHLPGAYNDNNELTEKAGQALNHDDNGNLLGVPAPLAGPGMSDLAFGFDVENRLVEVQTATGAIRYSYDPFNRRIAKDVYGQKTYFAYTDQGLAAELDVAGAVIRTYHFAPGSDWSTDPLFIKEGGRYFFYHNDHLGTPQGMTDDTGATVWSATYDAFGQATITAASLQNNLRFPGQYFDQETGLHDNWNRVYSPRLRRYVTTDPIGFEAGDSNLYRYAENDPTNKLDPEGETVVELLSAGVGTLQLAADLWNKKWTDAAVDALGVAADIVTAFSPVTTGGVGWGIRAARAVQATAHGAQAIQATVSAVEAHQEGHTGWAAFYGSVGFFSIGGTAKSLRAVADGALDGSLGRYLANESGHALAFRKHTKGYYRHKFSKRLEDLGVSGPIKRKILSDIMNNFGDYEKVLIYRAKREPAFWRRWGGKGKAKELGRYGAKGPRSKLYSRRKLAVRRQWNDLSKETRFRIRKGGLVIDGPTAPKRDVGGTWEYLPGGGEQRYVPFLDDLY